MELKVVKVTPKLASNWLTCNTINRPLRRSIVDNYLAAFKRGEYQLTHQGIAFADTGELLDGQHRLKAISEMPEGFALELLVAKGLSKDAFRVIDKGLKRQHSDILGIGTGHAAVARYMAKTYDTSRIAISTDFLIPFVEASRPHYDRLVKFCYKCSKTWASAPVRTAAILRMMDGGDFDYIGISYHALNTDDFDSMSTVVKALYRQQVRGLISGADDMFFRAWRAFDETAQNLPKIQISDTAGALAQVRSLMLEHVYGIKKKAGIAPAKKVNEGNSTRKAVSFVP